MKLGKYTVIKTKELSDLQWEASRYQYAYEHNQVLQFQNVQYWNIIHAYLKSGDKKVLDDSK